MKRTSRLLSAIILTALLLTITVALNNAADARPPRTLRSITGTVVRVIDGDTMKVRSPFGSIVTVRLYGIDAPEAPHGNMPGQPLGEASKSALEELVYPGSEVTIHVMAVDKYRRFVSIVETPSCYDSCSVNLSLLRAGMAEVYREYLNDEPMRSAYLEAERQAKKERRGIWNNASSYERPNHFRKRMSVSHFK
ncbi:MAG TPA: thermonuclease family protein [Methanoregulaceae archaeon]|nr:thermonuclease family protein [Sedimentisphaerales bacterium]HPD11275.1 thermonuclease family protein [Methanoregulaceae archaeon]